LGVRLLGREQRNGWKYDGHHGDNENLEQAVLNAPHAIVSVGDTLVPHGITTVPL